VRASAADTSRSLDHLSEEVDGLARGQAETGQLIEKLNLQENRTQALAARIDTLADMLAAQEQKLDMGIALAVADVAESTAAVPAQDPTLAAELADIRRQLLDADASQRFDAVDRVGRGRHRQLASELIPMLNDDDNFVRMLAMHILGDFGYIEAVPALFGVIEDPKKTIRKVAAETLVRLTGYDPGYDAHGSKSERDKAIKRWKTWVGDR